MKYLDNSFGDSSITRGMNMSNTSVKYNENANLIQYIFKDARQPMEFICLAGGSMSIVASDIQAYIKEHTCQNARKIQCR